MRRAFCFGIVIVLIGCSQVLSREEFADWVTNVENGLRIQKSTSRHQFDLQFAPAEFRAILRGDSHVAPFDSLEYYTLTISPKDNSDLIEGAVADDIQRQALTYYYSYVFQDEIRLERNGVSYPCVMYHFEQSVDLKSGRTFLLAFSTMDKDAEVSTLVIDSKKFDALPVKIKISKQNIPAVKL